jgi:hypothetical protein
MWAGLIAKVDPVIKKGQLKCNEKREKMFVRNFVFFVPDIVFRGEENAKNRHLDRIQCSKSS